MTYQEIVTKLSEPMPYQWRVQSTNKDKTKSLCIAFIDARDVMNAFDRSGVVWETAVKEVAGFIFYGIGIHVEGKTIWRWDTGSRIEDDPSKNMYDQAGKSAASDAFKRAAVAFGVGRFLYDIPPISLPCDKFGNVIDDQGQRVWDLTKHINNLKSGKKTAPPRPGLLSIPPPANVDTSTGEIKDVITPSELASLPQDKFDKMLEYIDNGKTAEVEKALANYKLTAAQRTVINAKIKIAKNDKGTKTDTDK